MILMLPLISLLVIGLMLSQTQEQQHQKVLLTSGTADYTFPPDEE